MVGSSITHKLYVDHLAAIKLANELALDGVRKRVADRFGVLWSQLCLSGKTLLVMREPDGHIAVSRMAISFIGVAFYIDLGVRQLTYVKHQDLNNDPSLSMRVIQLCFQDAKFDMRTTINGTRQEIIQYYAWFGSELNVGNGADDNMQRLVRIEFLGKSDEDPIIVYDLEAEDE